MGHLKKNALNINQSYDRYSSILQTRFKVADIKLLVNA